MSVNLTPADVPPKETARPIEQIAREHEMDGRISRLVPGFDMPFFQAGLAGYSDAAMRLVARKHGCPYAVTEALLDQTLISGGKGRTREDPDILVPPLSEETCDSEAEASPTVRGVMNSSPCWLSPVGCWSSLSLIGLMCFATRFASPCRESRCFPCSILR